MKVSYLSLIVTICLLGCNQDDVNTLLDFKRSTITIKERSIISVSIKSNGIIKANDAIYVNLAGGSATYNTDYTTNIPLEGSSFKISGTGTDSLNIEFYAIYDTLMEGTESIELEIEKHSAYARGNSSRLTISIANNNIGNNLVGEYLFNGSAEDTSPDYNNHGNVLGSTPTADRDGNSNSAYSFDGINDYISIPDNTATDFNSTGDFSISLWVSPNLSQNDQTVPFHDILRKWVGDTQPYPFSISLLPSDHPDNPNQFLMATYDGSGCSNSTLSYSGSIRYEEFNHLVMIKKGNKILQYLNGNKVSEVNSTLACQTSNNTHITIGCRGQLVRFFTGKVDDIRFYKAALSASVVEELFNEAALH